MFLTSNVFAITHVIVIPAFPSVNWLLCTFELVYALLVDFSRSFYASIAIIIQFCYICLFDKSHGLCSYKKKWFYYWCSIWLYYILTNIGDVNGRNWTLFSFYFQEVTDLDATYLDDVHNADKNWNQENDSILHHSPICKPKWASHKRHSEIFNRFVNKTEPYL